MNTCPHPDPFPRKREQLPEDSGLSRWMRSSPAPHFTLRRRKILPFPGGEGRGNGERPTNLLALLLVILLSGTLSQAAEYPAPTAGDYTIRDFRFRSGETMPEVRMHYLRWGSPQKDANGIVTNAVLILHGTTGSSTQFQRREFAGELFGPGQLLDSSRYFIIIPDNLRHGRSTKPSDSLRPKFPNYGNRDMIEAL